MISPEEMAEGLVKLASGHNDVTAPYFLEVLQHVERLANKEPEKRAEKLRMLATWFREQIIENFFSADLDQRH